MEHCKGVAWLDWYQDWAMHRKAVGAKALPDGFRKAVEGERIGQAFCNDFIKGPWPELYYEEDHQKAITMIFQWLQDNCYGLHNIPPKLNRSLTNAASSSNISNVGTQNIKQKEELKNA